jgi:hypothetical protein
VDVSFYGLTQILSYASISYYLPVKTTNAQICITNPCTFETAFSGDEGLTLRVKKQASIDQHLINTGLMWSEDVEPSDVEFALPNFRSDFPAQFVPVCRVVFEYLKELLGGLSLRVPRQ